MSIARDNFQRNSPDEKKEAREDDLNRMRHDALRMAIVIMRDIAEILLDINDVKISPVIRAGGKPGFKIEPHNNCTEEGVDELFSLIKGTLLPENIPFYIDSEEREVFFDGVTSLPHFIVEFCSQNDTHFVDKIYDIPRIVKNNPQYSDPKMLRLLSRPHYGNRQELKRYFDRVEDDIKTYPLFHFTYTPEDLEAIVNTLTNNISGLPHILTGPGTYVH